MNTIHLRRWTENDLSKLIDLETDADVVKNTTVRFPLTYEQIHARLFSQINQQPQFEPFGIWLAESATDHSFIGWCMLLPRGTDQIELGYMIKKSLWNQGYTTEIVRKLIEYAKHNKAPSLMAKIDPDNVASEKVLIKNGFQFIKSEIEQDKILKKDITLKIYQKDLSMNDQKPNYKLINNSSAHRFEFHIENNIAYIDYSTAMNTVSLNKVFVPKELENRGIASALMKATLTYLKEKKHNVKPVCSFAISYFEKHPEFKDLLK